jgi:cytochrome c oxidase subunit II
VMIGWVYVMSPDDYAAWLAGGEKNESMAQAGEQLFTRLGCVTCHTTDGTGRGPSLAGIYGTSVKLATGETRTVDESFLRQAIVVPDSLQLPNYKAIMPTFQGQVDEVQVLDLVAYVKSLGLQERTNGK